MMAGGDSNDQYDWHGMNPVRREAKMCVEKIKVPEAMLEAMWEAQLPCDRPTLGWDEANEINRRFYRRTAEAALGWFIDQEPTDDEAKLILWKCFGYGCNVWNGDEAQHYLRETKKGIMELKRRMFVRPEPDVPEEIKDLLWDLSHSAWQATGEKHNAETIEAFRRGRASRNIQLNISPGATVCYTSDAADNSQASPSKSR